MATWFSADYHFGHANIIQHCHRPYKNIHKMQTQLIKNINNAVQVKDKLIIAGDFSMYGVVQKHIVKQIRDQINCRNIILILGNHDALYPFDYTDFCGFESVHTRLEYENLIINHDPGKAYQESNKVWITGHVHTHWKTNRNCINVGIDMWQYNPVHIDMIFRTIKGLTM